MDCARVLCGLAAIALSGCAQHARLQVFRPADHDLVGIERIAILDFEGPQPHAQLARDAVVAEFKENRSYTLVEPAVFQKAVFQGAEVERGQGNRAATLAAARRAGIDAVLEVQLTSAALPDSPAGPWTADLIDARSGAVLAGTQLRVASAVEGSTQEQLAASLVTQLAPHYEEIEVELARQRWGEGRARVAAGNALARQGEWITAAEEWEQARRANPANHAALHNLALVAEARQDYRLAFKLLDQAMAEFPARLYHQTRRAMEERQTTFLAAVKQVEAIRDAARGEAGIAEAAAAQ